MRVPLHSPLSGSSFVGRGDQSIRGRLLSSVSGLARPAASATLALGVSLVTSAHAQTVVTPVQNTTYNLNPANNPITFGAGTSINVSGNPAVAGAAGTAWNVTAQSGTLFNGTTGISLQGAGSTVNNSGQIGGVNTNTNGVYLENGGSVTNQTGGAISGGSIGASVNGAPGTVINSGTIDGTGRAGKGVYLQMSGSVTNLAGGTITGNAVGVATCNGRNIGPAICPVVGSVTNAGVITAKNAGSYGIEMFGGGSLTNLAGGTVTGGRVGILFGNDNPSRLINGGTITGGEQGAYFSGGTIGVTNLAGGKIAGNAYGIMVRYNSTITVTNAGTIAGGNGNIFNDQGIFLLTSGGSISNLAGGTISGGHAGIDAINGPSTIVNAGTITSAHGYGVLVGSGSVTNLAGAMISGGLYGVVFAGSGTVTNAGTITGGPGGASVKFFGRGANTLTLQTGSVLNGDAVGSTAVGATNALILQGSGSANNNFLNFNTLDVQANGIWALNGQSQVGAATVTSGTLVVGDANNPGAQLTGSVTVNAGGVLAGQGTVIGNVTAASGGTIAPGASTPFTTLQVNGNATFSPGSFFNVNVNPAGQSDKLTVSGTATLSGGTVEVLTRTGSNITPGTRYTIVTAGSLGNTSFAGVTTAVPFAFLTPMLTTDANEVFLTLSRNSTSFLSLAQTPNQSSVATALNAASSTNPLKLAVLNQTVAGARQAFDALSGEIYGSLQNTLVDESQFVRSAMLGRLRQSSYASAPGELGALGFGGPELAYAMGSVDGAFPTKAPPARAAGTPRDLAFWTQTLGGFGHADGDGNAATLNSRFEGFLSGVDALFGTVRAGFTAGYLHSDVNVDARSSSAGIDSAQLGLYAGSKVGPLSVRTGAAYTFDTIDARRTVAFPGLFEPVSASSSANVGQVFGEVGYGVAFGSIALEPFAGLAYVNVHTGAFAENGGIAALSGLSNDESVGYSSLGLRAATIVPLANGTFLVPRLSAQWQYAFGDVTPQAALAFQSTGTGFSVSGVPIARNAALVDTGLDWRITSKMKVGLSYQGELAEHVQTHTFKGGFTWNF